MRGAPFHSEGRAGPEAACGQDGGRVGLGRGLLLKPAPWGSGVWGLLGWHAPPPGHPLRQALMLARLRLTPVLCLGGPPWCPLGMFI